MLNLILNHLRHILPGAFSRFATIIFLSLSISACQSDRREPPDQNEKEEIQIQRFEKELMALNPDSLVYQISRLEATYERFFELFNYQVIRIGSPNEKDYPDLLERFLFDPVMREALKSTINQFDDFEKTEQDLKAGFSNYRAFFPGQPLPRIVTFFGGFNQSIILTDSILGIGLDKYLGGQSPFYSSLGVPRYMLPRMEPGRIPLDALYGWASTELVWKGEDNLLGNMIREGRLMYLLYCLFPGKPALEIFPYSEEEWKWLESSERTMWAYLIEKQLLFNSDYKIIMRFMNDGPFTQPFSESSPSKAGVWIGFRIVMQYMKKNQEVGIPKLFAIENPQEILAGARYDP